MLNYLARMVVVIAAIQTVTSVAEATLITQNLTSLSGTIDPITYTTVEGTFTTSTINLALNPSTTSFFTIDTDTNVVTAHTVMDIFFNNGNGNDLSGTFTINEIGTFGPSPIYMDIVDGVLSGAGDFAGAKVKGKNPTFFFLPPFIKWKFPIQDQHVFLDLPPMYIGGTDIEIYGEITATVVPEPGSLVLLSSGLLGLFICTRKRRKKAA